MAIIAAFTCYIQQQESTQARRENTDVKPARYSTYRTLHTGNVTVRKHLYTVKLMIFN